MGKTSTQAAKEQRYRWLLKFFIQQENNLQYLTWLKEAQAATFDESFYELLEEKYEKEHWMDSGEHWVGKNKKNAFIRYNPKGKDAYSIPTHICTSNQNPWRTHVSFGGRPENIRKVYAALRHLLKEEHNISFKLVLDDGLFEEFSRPGHPENGKILTIFPRDVPSAKKTMIPQIEAILSKARIPIGLSPQEDLRVGHYCYVIDPYDINGNYRDPYKGQRHGYVVKGKADPFKGMGEQYQKQFKPPSRTPTSSTTTKSKTQKSTASNVGFKRKSPPALTTSQQKPNGMIKVERQENDVSYWANLWDGSDELPVEKRDFVDDKTEEIGKRAFWDDKTSENPNPRIYGKNTGKTQPNSLLDGEDALRLWAPQTVRTTLANAFDGYMQYTKNPIIFRLNQAFNNLKPLAGTSASFGIGFLAALTGTPEVVGQILGACSEYLFQLRNVSGTWGVTRRLLEERALTIIDKLTLGHGSRVLIFASTATGWVVAYLCTVASNGSISVGEFFGITAAKAQEILIRSAYYTIRGTTILGGGSFATGTAIIGIILAIIGITLSIIELSNEAKKYKSKNANSQFYVPYVDWEHNPSKPWERTNARVEYSALESRQPIFDQSSMNAASRVWHEELRNNNQSTNMQDKKDTIVKHAIKLFIDALEETHKKGDFYKRNPKRAEALGTLYTLNHDIIKGHQLIIDTIQKISPGVARRLEFYKRYYERGDYKRVYKEFCAHKGMKKLIRMSTAYQAIFDKTPNKDVEAFRLQMSNISFKNKAALKGSLINVYQQFRKRYKSGNKPLLQALLNYYDVILACRVSGRKLKVVHDELIINYKLQEFIYYHQQRQKIMQELDKDLTSTLRRTPLRTH